MAFTEYTEDTDIIASLPDDPNDSGGLTAAELKEKFDENSTKIVEFLNDTLIAELNSTTAGSSGADKVGYGGDIAVDNVADALDLIYAGGSGTIPPDNTITAAKLTTDAVETAKIKDGAVTPAKCADYVMPGLLPWELLEAFTTAGNDTFIAPDLYNGADYEIGAYIVGAGGGGAALKLIREGDSENESGAASGGASGYARVYKMTVSPSDEIAVVVGAGGAAVSSTTASSGAAGNAGGASSFNSISASGGGGGVHASSENTTLSASGADGGQGSDAIRRDDTPAVAPAMGETTRDVDYPVCGGRTRPGDALNPFTLIRTLGAGGGAYGSTTTPSATAQTVPTLEDDLVAGAATVVADGTGTTNAVGLDATSPGSGGGAAVLATSATTSTTTGIATSGAGADGAVFIYARKFAL